MTINVYKNKQRSCNNNFSLRELDLNINYHQCPLIVPLILFMSISKEKINVPELMTINVHKNKQRSCKHLKSCRKNHGF